MENKEIMLKPVVSEKSYALQMRKINMCFLSTEMLIR